jgi:EAL domain-containing protein (putative c-di-GMP-specific phosphodiesterase class I)
MYEAKSRGRGRWAMFDAVMQAAVQTRLQLENELRAGIGADQCFLVYQPIVSLTDDTPGGVEALVRWNHPVRGVLPPSEFIPLAEETRLIVPLGAWVLEKACRQLMNWRRQTPERAPSYVSVNLSRVQLEDWRLVQQVAEIIRRTGIGPDRLVLEITESTIMQNPCRAKEMLGALKGMGVRLAIDDFGTGYSSLSCLHEFPFDVLKIHRSFIANLERSREFIALTQSVVTLAHYFGLKCVAEGVENGEQIAVLLSMGCDFAQGYWFGRPMSAKAVIDGDWKTSHQAEATERAEAVGY